MKKYWLIVLSLLACFFSTSFASNMVSVQIVWNWLVIGTPWAVHVWTLSAWNSWSYTFSWPNFFWIRDLRWLSQWHYTTIQCDGLYRVWWDWVITGVMLKATAWQLSWWLANQTKINAALQSWEWLDITEPVLYFYRNDGWHNSGVTNRYIDYPTITVNVPSWTPSGTYKWRITYTLYDMNFDY